MANVLLVEDHDLVRRMLCDVIHQAGYQADCVKTVAECRRLLDQQRYDLAVVSVSLPDGTGYEVAEWASRRGVTVVLMSGQPDEIQALTLAQKVHLQKPFSIQEFQKMLKQHLAEDD